ncbi:MAG: hypothetical protein CSA18_03675 [Deltaproteobacteria bacterium]|nr:MAG: hypothetical protein CSA18_03675 [Deltaproteobacteria bacterium]
MILKFHKNPLFRFSRKISSFPSYINKKYIYIIPTSPGIIFLSVIFIIFIGSFNENNNMGLLFSFFLFSLLVTSIWETRKNLLNLKINSINIENTFAGQNSRVIINLSSEKKDKEMIVLKARDCEALVELIKKNSAITAEIFYSSSRRGIFEPETIIISSSSPFGIFRAFSYIIPADKQVVYPKPSFQPIPPHYTMDSDEISDTGSRIKKNEENYNGLREYVKGDNIKRISWKAYSKGLGLFVKDFETNVDKDEILILWDKIPIENTEEKLELICKTILDFDSAGTKYGLVMPDLKIPVSKGEKHRINCLSALAEFNENK